MSLSSGDGFRTPQMIQAERELDGRINVAFNRARELQAKVQEVDEKLARDKKPLTNEEVDRFRAYILGHAMTDEWKPVTERIERGELTWRQIVEGLAEGRLDPEVKAALASLTKVPPATKESLVSIGVLPDLDKAAQDAEGDEKPRGRDDRRSAPVDDDEWFEDHTILGRH